MGSLKRPRASGVSLLSEVDSAGAGYLYYTIGLARCQGQIRQDCQISALKITSCGHKEKAFKGLDFAARDCIIEA
jgi:hypothetical protein